MAILALSVQCGHELPFTQNTVESDEFTLFHPQNSLQSSSYYICFTYWPEAQNLDDLYMVAMRKWQSSFLELDHADPGGHALSRTPGC